MVWQGINLEISFKSRKSLIIVLIHRCYIEAVLKYLILLITYPVKKRSILTRWRHLALHQQDFIPWFTV